MMGISTVGLVQWSYKPKMLGSSPRCPTNYFLGLNALLRPCRLTFKQSRPLNNRKELPSTFRSMNNQTRNTNEGRIPRNNLYQRQMLTCFLPSPSKNERQRQSEKVYLDSPHLATRSLKGAGQVADDFISYATQREVQCKLQYAYGFRVILTSVENSRAN